MEALASTRKTMWSWPGEPSDSSSSSVSSPSRLSPRGIWRTRRGALDNEAKLKYCTWHYDKICYDCRQGNWGLGRGSNSYIIVRAK